MEKLKQIYEALMQCGIKDSSRLYYLGDNINGPASVGVFLMLGDSDVESVEELAIIIKDCLKDHAITINKINSGCLSIAPR